MAMALRHAGSNEAPRRSFSLSAMPSLGRFLPRRSWHRAGFRLFWRLRSRPRRGSPLAKETIDLIRDMARRGRLWGAERT